MNVEEVIKNITQKITVKPTHQDYHNQVLNLVKQEGDYYECNYKDFEYYLYRDTDLGYWEAQIKIPIGITTYDYVTPRR